MFNNIPPITKYIIYVNVGMFVLTYILEGTFGIDFSRFASLSFHLSEDFMPHQVITHMFMHGSPMHIFMNMWALFIFGPILEMQLGPKKFLTYYMLTGIGAVILHYLSYYVTDYNFIMETAQLKSAYNSDSVVKYIETYTPSLREARDSFDPGTLMYNHYSEILAYLKEARTQIINGASLSDKAVNNITELFVQKTTPPMVGASGAVFGIFAGFTIFFPNLEVRLIFLPFRSFKVKQLFVAYTVYEIAMILLNFSGDMVAHFAHLGGALFGYLIIREWKNKRLI